MKKIVGLSLALIMVVGVIGGETFARFTDNETSSGNQLVAGTLDLRTNDANGVSQTLYATDMEPGATIGPSTITLKNDGTTNGATLDIAFAYVESDGTPNAVNMTDDQTAAIIEVTTMTYGGTDILASKVTDANVNGYKDIQDVKNANLTGLAGINANTSKGFGLSVRLRSDTGSDFQADGINVTMTFTLKQ